MQQIVACLTSTLPTFFLFVNLQLLTYQTVKESVMSKAEEDADTVAVATEFVKSPECVDLQFTIKKNGGGHSISPPKREDLRLPTQPLRHASQVYAKFSHDRAITPDYRTYYGNGLLDTIVTAYNLHLGLRLTPEDILLAVDDIVSKFVTLEADKYRNTFVDRTKEAGKDVLWVDMDKLVPTPEQTVWDLTMDEWIRMVREKVKCPAFVDNMTCDFSTSSHIDKLVSYGFVMNTAKQYFHYVSSTRCGIPQVHLAGTIADWERVAEKIDALCTLLDDSRFTLYMDSKVLPVVREFMTTKRGTPNKEWWSRLVHHNVRYGSGGGAFWTGWLVNLFPEVEKSYNGAVGIIFNSKLNNVSTGKTKVPITFIQNGAVRKLELIAGFHGVRQWSDGSLGTIRGVSFVPVTTNADDSDIDFKYPNHF